VLLCRLSLQEAAAEFKLSRQSAAKWVRRYRARARRAWRSQFASSALAAAHGGRADRASGRLRRERWTGMRIAPDHRTEPGHRSRILTRLQLNKIRMLEPALPIVRYEHPAPAICLHIDIKKLARIHKPGHRLTESPRRNPRRRLGVPLRGHRRPLRIRLHRHAPDEKATSSSAFPRQAVAYFAPARHPRPPRL